MMCLLGAMCTLVLFHTHTHTQTQGPRQVRVPSDPAARANRARAGGDRGRTARAHGVRAEPGLRGGPPPTAACDPSAWHARE